jgi:hypothetical protein
MLHRIRRSLGNRLAITRGRLRGRTFAPHPRRAIFIETSARCNLACRFCAYEQTGPGSLMGMDLFRSTVGQIVDLGFNFIYLTPMLGEAFADPTLFEKFELLEREPAIRGYSFYSNFILPDPEDVLRLPRWRKLHALYISLYGFDEPSFVLTTRKPAIQFQRLHDNLEALLQATAAWRPLGGMHFNARTVRTETPFLKQPTPFVGVLNRLLGERGATLDESDEYDSWGGTISEQDVEPLGIAITDGRDLYMYGACTKVFGELQIKADGTVHACACRDLDGSLRIGHLGSTPLAGILSWDNPLYRRLIENQMQGRFGPNCRSCSSYRSVFDDRASRQDPSLEVMEVGEAVSRLTARPEKP